MPDSSNGTTHVLMLIDMSASMGRLANDVRGGFNTYIDELASSDGNYRLTVTLFNTGFRDLCVDTPVRVAPQLNRVNYPPCPCCEAKLKASRNQVPRLYLDNYRPFGLTALLDAVARTIGNFEQRVPALPGDDRVLLVVQTDGEENASCEHSWSQVFSLISAREATGQWSFHYLGQHADAWRQAGRMGFQPSSTYTVENTGGGTRSSYEGLTAATIAYSGGADTATTSGILREFTSDTSPAQGK